MTELTLELFVTLFYVTIGILATVAAILFNSMKDSLNSRADSLDKKLSDISSSLRNIDITLAATERGKIIDAYRGMSGALSGPSSYTPPPERDILLEKLRLGVITIEENARLQAILRKEAELAKQKNLGDLLLAILALIFILAVLEEIFKQK